MPLSCGLVSNARFHAVDRTSSTASHRCVAGPARTAAAQSAISRRSHQQPPDATKTLSRGPTPKSRFKTVTTTREQRTNNANPQPQCTRTANPNTPKQISHTNKVRTWPPLTPATCTRTTATQPIPSNKPTDRANTANAPPARPTAAQHPRNHTTHKRCRTQTPNTAQNTLGSCALAVKQCSTSTHTIEQRTQRHCGAKTARDSPRRQHPDQLNSRTPPQRASPQAQHVNIECKTASSTVCVQPCGQLASASTTRRGYVRGHAKPNGINEQRGVGRDAGSPQRIGGLPHANSGNYNAFITASQRHSASKPANSAPNDSAHTARAVQERLYLEKC